MPTSWRSAAGASSTFARRSWPRSSGAGARRSSWAARTRRSARSGSSTAPSTSCSSGRPSTPGPSSAGTSSRARRPKPVYEQDRQGRHHQVARFLASTSSGRATTSTTTSRRPAAARFACEFCDIIITDGRVPRLKSVEQVLQGDRDDRRPRREVHLLLRREPHREPEVRRAAPRRRCGEFGGRTAIPIRFSAELTINGRGAAAAARAPARRPTSRASSSGSSRRASTV